MQFTLNKGDRIGVLGLNGHGKSSFFQVLLERLTPDTTVPPFQFDKSREFSIFEVPQDLPVIKGMSLTKYFYEFYPEMKSLREELDGVEAEISQNPDSTKLNQLIETQTKLYEELNRLNEDHIHQQYLSYLKYFGHQDPELPMDNLSGGELRKIGLSLGLCCPHEIVLWDEPTNHLDLETIELFEDEMMNLNKTFLIISHDRSLLNNLTDRILHIQKGKLQTFQGNYQQYLTYLQEVEEQRLKEVTKLSNTHRRETAWMRRGISARRTRSKKRVDDYHSLSKQIDQLRSMAHAKASLSLKSSQRKTKRLVLAEGLSKAFGDKKLINQVDFEICKGDKIALLGQNGVGKSTLIKMICEQELIDSGKLEKAHQLDIGYFSQNREALPEEVSPWDLLGEGTDYVYSNVSERKHVASYLESFLFRSDEIKRPISTLSGGEKNRLQLAQFMKDAKDIWIFDEPTNDLDLETIGILEEELKTYQGAVIIICHDRNFIENVCDKFWVIDDQKIHQFEGGLEQAKSFMEANLLEKKLSELKAQDKPTKAEVKTPEKKVSFKQKERYEEVQQLIDQKEQQINEIDNLLNRFDYTSSDNEQTELIAQLQQKLQKLNSELEELMDEWSELEELIS